MLIAESRGLLQIAKFHLDFGVALFALHFGLAVGPGHQLRAREIQLGGSPAMLIVACLYTTADYDDPDVGV